MARQKLKQWLKPDGALVFLGSVTYHARKADVNYGYLDVIRTFGCVLIRYRLSMYSK